MSARFSIGQYDRAMRLFTGLDLPAAGGSPAWRGCCEQLRPTARINWSPPRNLHITTKFIGEWPEERLAELKAALAALPARRRSNSRAQVGFFPNPHRPRVFWAGVEAPRAGRPAPPMTDRALAAPGHRERRAAVIRRTSRWPASRSRCPAAAAAKPSPRCPSLDFGDSTADRFCLYHSRPGPRRFRVH